MYVLKRDGRREPVHFDKITARISRLSYGLNPDFCDPVRFLCRGRAGSVGRRTRAIGTAWRAGQAPGARAARELPCAPTRGARRLSFRTSRASHSPALAGLPAARPPAPPPHPGRAGPDRSHLPINGGGPGGRGVGRPARDGGVRCVCVPSHRGRGACALPGPAAARAARSWANRRCTAIHWPSRRSWIGLRPGGRSPALPLPPGGGRAPISQRSHWAGAGARCAPPPPSRGCLSAPPGPPLDGQAARRGCPPIARGRIRGGAGSGWAGVRARARSQSV